MSSRPPRSLASLLWEMLRLSASSIWKSDVNPMYGLMQRQQALSVLGLPPNATPDQIKRRYRALAKRYHPDLGGDQRQMQKIIAAYEFLVKEHQKG